jgi:hypothetical protein
MEEMIIGKLHPDDQDKIDAEMDKMMEKDGDPYEDEPERHPLLIVHSDSIEFVLHPQSSPCAIVE